MLDDKKRGIVVTTDRGIFFGYGTPRPGEKDVQLERCRAVVYWSSNIRSTVVGLAVNGPMSGCCVSPPAQAAIIKDATAIIECTDEAVKRFEDAAWIKQLLRDPGLVAGAGDPL